MKRFLLLIGIGFFLSSCSAEDIHHNLDKEEYSLIGEWEYLYRLEWYEANGRASDKIIFLEFPSPVIFKFEKDSSISIDWTTHKDVGKFRTHENAILVDLEERQDTFPSFPFLRHFWVTKDTLFFQPNPKFHKDIKPPTQPGALGMKVVDYLIPVE